MCTTNECTYYMKQVKTSTSTERTFNSKVLVAPVQFTLHMYISNLQSDVLQLQSVFPSSRDATRYDTMHSVVEVCISTYVVLVKKTAASSIRIDGMHLAALLVDTWILDSGHNLKQSNDKVEKARKNM